MYLIYCVACNLQYVECTTRALRTRIGKHYCDTVDLNAKHISNVSLNFRECHAGDLSLCRFTGIEKLTPMPRGEDKFRKMLNREAWWIFRLKTRVPPGVKPQLGPGTTFTVFI